MSTTTTMNSTATRRHLLAGLAAGFCLVALTERAEAQEILLTGPLAGAPAVRKLRLYRQNRFELSPGVSFTILDEYQRTILPGLQLTYNFTDWLGLGVYGAYGGAIRITTGLTDRIQDVNRRRDRLPETNIDRRLTAVNLGRDFKDQLGAINWILAPQLTGVPFRGKLSLFAAIYTDTEIFFYAGPAFVNLSERKDCTKPQQQDTACINIRTQGTETQSRMAIAPTFGLGLTFFVNQWNSLGLEYRALPFAWNTGGFDTAGGGRDEEFPDGQINDSDRRFTFNQLLTVRWNFYLPTRLKISE